jgi:hypothetical protein
MGEFLQNNWFWLLLLGLFIWMHSSGMGCCGHGGQGHGDAPGTRRRTENSDTSTEGTPRQRHPTA